MAGYRAVQDRLWHVGASFTEQLPIFIIRERALFRPDDHGAEPQSPLLHSLRNEEWN